jgi:pyruvate kinase
MIKLTKIVATMGPRLQRDQIQPLINSGVDCFRFNFKHHDYDWHKERIGWVQDIARSSNQFIGTLLDLQGPEIRLTLQSPELSIKVGDWLLLTNHLQESYEPSIMVSHPRILRELEEGANALVSGGALDFTITRRNDQLYLVSNTAGVLKTRQTLSVPRHSLTIPTLSDRDLMGIKLAKEMGVTYTALSFVRNADDVKELKKALKSQGCEAKVISKIETSGALDCIHEIVAVSDGLMVARGDLAVEASMAEVPYYQKVIIKQAIKKGKFVITATQMLESMITNPKPTRAEVSDVATAAYDYSDAVMLSAETAVGAYPIQTVETMSSTLMVNEKHTPNDTRSHYGVSLLDAEAAMAEAAIDLSLKMSKHRKVTAFVVFTRSGYTPAVLSSFHSHLPILSFCETPEIARRLSLRFGVVALVNNDIYPVEPAITPEKILQSILHLSRLKLIEPSDSVIVLHENAWGLEPGTSSIKLIRVPE